MGTLIPFSRLKARQVNNNTRHKPDVDSIIKSVYKISALLTGIEKGEHIDEEQDEGNRSSRP